MKRSGFAKDTLLAAPISCIPGFPFDHPDFCQRGSPEILEV